MTLKRLDIVYALVAEHNPLTGDDPDDIAEAWNGARDAIDIRTGGELTARQLDLYADKAVSLWQKDRDLTETIKRCAEILNKEQGDKWISVSPGMRYKVKASPARDKAS